MGCTQAPYQNPFGDHARRLFLVDETAERTSQARKRSFRTTYGLDEITLSKRACSDPPSGKELKAPTKTRISKTTMRSPYASQHLSSCASPCAYPTEEIKIWELLERKQKWKRKKCRRKSYRSVKTNITTHTLSHCVALYRLKLSQSRLSNAL